MKIFTTLVIVLFTFTLNARSQNTVKSDSIVNPLHQANIGKITFMGELIPIEQYKESDFLTQFELKEKTDLNIRVFMDNSLTNYLHRLAPAMAVEELLRNGNYQFTFFVDDTLIYKENLNTGAGTAENKNYRTVLRVPLLSATDEDSWGRFLFRRFLINGGEEALTPGMHKLGIEIRPYLRTPELKTGELIASGDIMIKAPDRSINEKLIPVQNIIGNSGWEISDRKYDESKIIRLNTMITSNVFKDITGIVVIDDGKLLIEEYFNGGNRDTLNDTRSVGKSFASALTGIAISEGFIKNEDVSIKDFYDLKKFDNYSLKKEGVTLKSLMTMTSGFDGSDDNEESPGHEEKMYPASDWVKFTLDLAMDSIKETGKNWDYFTAGVVLLGHILDKSVPGGLERYADEKLFHPLGINKYQWQYSPQNVVNTAGGLRMSALDFAKFGQLYKNSGSWNGVQIIPQDWISKSLSKQVQLPGRDNEYYGYLFWNKTFVVNDIPYETYYATGNGGNKIFIFKDKPWVIVLTSVAYNQPYAHFQADRIIEKYIIPAIEL